MSIDALQAKIRKMKNPTVAGLDPKLSYIPPHIVSKHIEESGQTLKAAANAYYEFGCAMIDALCDIVPAVKPQSAYYEALGYEGVEAMKKTIDYAKVRDMYVICDVKRNDIGSTAEAYSQAYLGTVKVGDAEYEPFGCDAVTVNAYLGSDGVNPFLELCKQRDKAIFILVKTSNPSSKEVQDLICGNRALYRAMGDLVMRYGKDLIGECGYSAVGAVVGATYPEDLKNLRKNLDRTFFLVPGYGAQGGKAADIEHAFDRFGHGAIINSSRAIMCAWQKAEGLDFAEAARNEAIRMRDEIKRFVTIV